LRNGRNQAQQTFNLGDTDQWCVTATAEYAKRHTKMVLCLHPLAARLVANGSRCKPR